MKKKKRVCVLFGKKKKERKLFGWSLGIFQPDPNKTCLFILERKQA